LHSWRAQLNNTTIRDEVMLEAVGVYPDTQGYQINSGKRAGMESGHAFRTTTIENKDKT
jgi:hypothetical protein